MVNTTSAQVKLLQEILALDKSVYPEGITTGFYGPLTVKAVERFQTKYGIVTSGTPLTTGFGLAGPATRAKIILVYGGGGGTGLSDNATTIAALELKIKELQALVISLTAQLKTALAQRGR